MAGCRTTRSTRWRPARTARSGSELAGGLARLDKSGEWHSYSKDGTHGGLPDDKVWALAPGADGALWVRTIGGGLATFHPPPPGTIRIVDVIGKTGEVTQAEQTIAVVAFDGSYLTTPGMFH